MFLVLLETSGNQSYIFATNKLKENIGASELTYRAGTQWVLEAVAQVTGVKALEVWKDGDRLRQMLIDPTKNPAIEDPETKAEIVVATSGKALILVKEERDAQSIIRQVTQRALKEAPGLEIAGVYEEFDWEKTALGEINAAVHRRYEQARAARPSSQARFARLPIIDECRTSGLPAQTLAKVPGSSIFEPISKLSQAKQTIQKEGRARIQKLLEKSKFDEEVVLADDNSDLEQEGAWVAVVHADGNGLGEIFLNFHKHLGAQDNAEDNRRYVNALRKFSLALDVCTENAFLAALQVFQQRLKKDKPLIPLVPMILGGDDLTVICDGQYALPFTHKFLQAFEYETTQVQGELGDVIPDLAARAFAGVRRLSACAGIAITKPHFPFSVAYDLAEALMKEAKRVKQHVQIAEGNIPYPCSALDFHVLFDSSDVALSTIRQKLKFQEGTGEATTETWLYQRPYVTTDLKALAGAKDQAWADFYHWQHFQQRVNLLLKVDPESGKRVLPNSQTHALRAGLFQGRLAADALYGLVRDRYPDLAQLAAKKDSGSLFGQAPPEDGKAHYVTALLDVVDAAIFVQEEEIHV